MSEEEEFYAKAVDAEAMIKTDGISYYCNIASPTLIDKDIVKYIDYDLDLKLFHNGSIKVLDENEYSRHKNKYQYSDRLDKVLTNEVDYIYSLMQQKVFPFVDKKIDEYYKQFIAYLDEHYGKDKSY